MLTIASWNCQGNPLDDPLSVGFLQRLLTDHDLVVLQSCGDLVGTSLAAVSDVTIGRIRCHLRGARQAISVDPNCSVAILSRLGSAFVLHDAEMLAFGQAGRFGVACTVALHGRSLLVAALHDVAGGLDEASWQRFRTALSARAMRDGQAILVAARLGSFVDPGADAVLADRRGILHPSPGDRHDCFVVIGQASQVLAGPVLIDSGGASDHDAVCAGFDL